MKATPDLNHWPTRRKAIKHAWTAAERENDNAGHTAHTAHDDTLDRLLAGATLVQREEVHKWAKGMRYLG